MMSNKADALLEKLQERIAAAPPVNRPVNRRVTPAVWMDAIVREAHERMIRHLLWRWGRPMQMLIDQACFGLSGIEDLDDNAVIALHRDLERAQECMRDGISFEDAGLLKSHCN